MDKDEQTTFIDSQGKLNPKAVKWSEVGLARGIGLLNKSHVALERKRW